MKRELGESLFAATFVETGQRFEGILFPKLFLNQHPFAWYS
jgi:hypothetical protein